MENFEPPDRIVERMCNNVNRLRINRAIHASNDDILHNTDDLDKAIMIYELRIIEHWQLALGSNAADSEEQKMFYNDCAECFYLMEAYPVPRDQLQMFIHTLKMLAYSYLGERWEDMRRYLSERKDWQESSVDADWYRVLFVGIFQAIILLARKESDKDLLESRRIISDLQLRQKTLEKPYLDSLPTGEQSPVSHQLASLYHLAKSTELLGGYMLNGDPDDIETHVDFHFENSLAHSNRAGVIDLDVLLRLLHPTFRKMASNSIWAVRRRVNSKINDFVEMSTRSKKPLFEFFYPQKLAILKGGLLDPASQAIVVNMPTFGGNIITAELRILQAVDTFGDAGKIVYVVPTRTLVNQITSRLRRDLGASPLNLKIEKVGGAVYIDGFEDEFIAADSRFNVLVATPEKLNLLIRHPEKNLAKSLVLAIVDEAHNMGNDSRGTNLEMLISTIRRDCPRAHLLLLTPFISNSREIAEWLDPGTPKSISMDLDWKPNDRAVGLCYARGKGKDITTHFKPLVTSSNTIKLDDEIQIGRTSNFSKTAYQVRKTKSNVASLLATQFAPSRNILIITNTKKSVWSIAKLIHENLPPEDVTDDDKVRLVQRFIKSELGNDFPLIKYLDKRIGMYHSGLPDDIRSLMEWLMEEGRLRVLVSTTTTTIAQGVNFPVSGLIMSSYSYVGDPMPHIDFWNVLGRVGRLEQNALGVVGIVVDVENTDDVNKTRKYVKETTKDLASTLVRMVDEALKISTTLDLPVLAHHRQEWSSFAQYVSHMFRQAGNLEQFVAESSLILKQTYGYGRLNPKNQKILLQAVCRYAEKLNARPHLSRLSDMTGLAPETIEGAMDVVCDMKITQEDWNVENLFSPKSQTLRDLVNIMVYMIPEIRDLFEAKFKRSAPQVVVGDIMTDWVSGREIGEIAKAYFLKNDADYKNAVTDCVNFVYNKITSYATWGLAGLQIMLSFEKEPGCVGNGHEIRQAANLPAMVYYGVDTEEAILMRMQGVPRGISKKLGAAYRTHYPNQDLCKADTYDVMDWLDEQPDDMWQPESGTASGADFKRVWRILSGRMDEDAQGA